MVLMCVNCRILFIQCIKILLNFLRSVMLAGPTITSLLLGEIITALQINSDSNFRITRTRGPYDLF